VTFVAQITHTAQGYTLHARFFNQGVQVIEGSSPLVKPLILPIPDANLWSTEDPQLYDLVLAPFICQKAIDQVSSYFGTRKLSLSRDT